MRDYFKRIRCKGRYCRYEITNKTVRSVAKNETKKELAKHE